MDAHESCIACHRPIKDHVQVGRDGTEGTEYEGNALIISKQDVSDGRWLTTGAPCWIGC